MTRQEWLQGQSWYQRWAARVERAWAEGVLDHTREPDALDCTPAKYGYLVPLTDPAALQAYEAEKKRLGLHGGMSDPQRLAWEDWYISKHRAEQKTAPSSS